MIKSIHILPLLILLHVSCSTKPKVIEIEENKVGMIGYGSLLSLKSMQETLKRAYTDSIYRVHLRGYIREWTHIIKNEDPGWGPEALNERGFYIHNNDTIPFNKTIYLNIAEDKNSRMNCVLYFITESDLELFDKREIGYKRIDVTENIEEYTFEHGKVYAYIATPEYTKGIDSDSIADIIPRPYVELVTKACDSIGVNFKEEYNASTRPFGTRVGGNIFWEKIN